LHHASTQNEDESSDPLLPLGELLEIQNHSNPSPLTLPSNFSKGRNDSEESNEDGNENDNGLVSVHHVNFYVTKTGVALSVPIMTTARNVDNQQSTYHDGYDSNDECSPFFNAVSGKNNDQESNDKSVADDADANANATALPLDDAVPRTQLLMEEEINKMNVNQLKENGNFQLMGKKWCSKDDSLEQ